MARTGLERTAQDRRVGTGELGQDNKNRTARKSKLGQYRQNRKARTLDLKKDGHNRTAENRTTLTHRTARIWKLG